MKPAIRGSEEEMASRYSLARQFRDSLVALITWVLAHLFGILVMVSPWLILFSGGWRPFLRWYLLPYPFALVGFAIIMAFVSRRQLLVRVREWKLHADKEIEVRPRICELKPRMDSSFLPLRLNHFDESRAEPVRAELTAFSALTSLFRRIAR
jgi:hypothetical protein